MIKCLGICVILLCNLNLTFAGLKKIPSEKPKLIVVIVIDQMKYDYIYQYWEYFGENGFKKLVNGGTNCKDATYNYVYTQSAPGYATIASGTSPNVHGIVADSWYDRLKENTVSSIQDNDVKTIDGSFDAGRFSPKHLLSTTFSDELKFSDNGQSDIIGISLNPAGAILLTGHNANAAYWLDFNSGKWITSSYYMDSIPYWIKDFNNKKIPYIYIKNRQWIPDQETLNYRQSADSGNLKNSVMKRLHEFKYDIGANFNQSKNYDILQSTPYGNTLTTDFAIQTIINENLGKDEVTDYLAVNYVCNGYIGRKYGQGSLELGDSYIKLDKEIEQLVNFINQTVGEENTLIILTSDRGASFDPEYLSGFKLPADYFDQYQAMALLKSYLNAVFEKGDWVQYYFENQIYLNRNLIEDSNIPLDDFQTKVAQFMVQFSGVANAITSISLASSNFSSGIYEKFQNSYNQKRSGDILLNLEPGWIEKDDDLTWSNSYYTYDVHVPLVWYGWKIKRQTIVKPIDMTDIAPTLSIFLNISFTNACEGNPVVDLLE